MYNVYILRAILTLWSLLLLAPSLCFSGQGLPKAVIKSPIFDFGRVVQGTVVRHTFNIQNKGDTFLHIENIVQSCECSIDNVSKRIVQPGETSDISVTFDTSEFLGKNVGVIGVKTNDPKNPVITLTLHGEIVPPLIFSSDKIDFGNVSKSKGLQTRQLMVKVAEGQRVKIIDIIPQHGSLSIRNLKKTSSEATFSIVFDPSVVRTGIFRERITVYFTMGKRGKLAYSLPVIASVTN